MLCAGLNGAMLYAVVDGLGHAPAYAGVLYAVQGAGSVAIGLLSGPALRRLGERRFAAYGIALTAVAAGLRAIPSDPVALACSAASGVGLPCVLIAALTAVQRETPDALLGRAAATANTLVFTPNVIGLAAGAALVELLDLRLAVARPGPGVAGDGRTAASERGESPPRTAAKVPVRRQPRVIEPQLRGPQLARACRVRRRVPGLPPMPETTVKLAAMTAPSRALLGEGCQQAGAARAGHDHAVRDGEDVRRVDARVGADVVRTRGRRAAGPGSRRGRPRGPPRPPSPGACGRCRRATRAWRPRGVSPSSFSTPAQPSSAAVALPHRFQRGAHGGRQLVGVQALAAVALPAGRAEAERHQVLPGVPERDPAGLVVGVQVLQPVPAEGLQLGAARPGPYGRLGGQVDEVRARGGLRDARAPRGSGRRRR